MEEIHTTIVKMRNKPKQDTPNREAAEKEYRAYRGQKTGIIDKTGRHKKWWKKK